MICPYCSEKMESGFIKSYGEKLTWSPIGEAKPLARWGVSEGGFQLGEYSFLRGGKVYASHCGKCKKIIIDA